MAQERKIKHCLSCGKPITTGRMDKKYCNKHCRRQAELARSRAKWARMKAERPTAPPRPCEYCGKMMTFEGARPIVVARKKYCSEKCSNAIHSKRANKRRRKRIVSAIRESGIPLNRTCAFCGKEFVIEPGKPNQGYTSLNRIYCSRQCSNHAVQSRRDWAEQYQKRRADILQYYETRRREAGVSPIGSNTSKPHQAILEYYELVFPNCDVLCNHPVLTNPETGRELRFDIWVPQKQLAIEVDGPHHRRSIWGKKHLAYVQYLDALKDRLAAEAGIHLIRIPVE